MNKSFLLLTALGLIAFSVNSPSVSAEEMTAGDILTENTAEMTSDAETAFDQSVDCAEQAMSGDEVSEECASQDDTTGNDDAVYDETYDAITE